MIALSDVLNRLEIHSERGDEATFRNAAGVAMKLGNLASLDPTYAGTGLSRVGANDRRVWEEFDGHEDRLRSEAGRIRSRVDESRPARPVKYWTLRALPERYRIEDAIANLETDKWTTRGSDPRAGDVVSIWKLKGRSSTSGIVALGEVLTDPVLDTDVDNPYWVEPGEGVEAVDRVTVRYVRPPGVPLWTPHPALDDLPAARAQGGTVFTVSGEAWERLLDALGGWPAPETESLLDALSEAAGRTRTRQGRSSDAARNTAVELRAMEEAATHLRAEGWGVHDVSANNSFDLLCRRGTEELHVEVKGTTSTGDQVNVTFNEVEHARGRHVLLLVVAGIEVSRDAAGRPSAQGGTVRVLDPWNPDDGVLRPISYTYTLP